MDHFNINGALVIPLLVLKCVVDRNKSNLVLLSLTGRRKVHFTFKDGKELAEEYDVRDGKLIGMMLICYLEMSMDGVSLLLPVFIQDLYCSWQTHVMYLDV